MSIALDPAMRGKGYGTAALHLLALRAMRHGLTCLVAFIRPDNAASLTAFRHAGFSGNAQEGEFVRLDRKVWAPSVTPWWVPAPK